MKDGPKAEPSGTVARMEKWTEGGTFGNGGADEDGPKAEPSGTVARMRMDRRRNLRERWCG